MGILTPGPKLAALTGNRVLYRDGLPVAVFAGGEARFLEALDPGTQWQARKALLRRTVPSPQPDADGQEAHLNVRPRETVI